MSETKKYRKFTAQQKTEIVLATLRGPKTMTKLCREHDIGEFLAGGAEAPVGEDGADRAVRASLAGLKA